MRIQKLTKNTFKIVIIFISVIFFLQCTTEEEVDDYHTYYKFTDDDYKNIISYDYNLNDILTYQNQFGEQLNFKVVYSETKKRGQYQSGFFGSSLSYYYDGKIIRLECLENITDVNLSGHNDELINYMFLKGHERLKSGLNFPMWNVSSSSFLEEMQNSISFVLWNDYNTQRQEMNINGHLFSNVIIINSESNSLLYPNSILLPNNVNEIFYDFDFGIIQFNDIENKQWKLIYPN